jgi:hypothetical protein
MSQERVGRLEALLSRVQDNRKRTRTPAGLGMNMARPEIAKAVAPAAAPAPEAFKPAPVVAEVAKPAAPARPAPIAAPITPAVRTMPPAPPSPVAKPQPIARPAIAEAPAPRAEVQPPRSAEPLPARRGQDRSATPLEMAVAELDLASAAAQNKAEARREPPAAAPAPAPVPIAPPIAPEEAFEARVIEPEPMREPARPIAQVVSRHAPQVDATFGAMLKRSLSLRPH